MWKTAWIIEPWVYCFLKKYETWCHFYLLVTDWKIRTDQGKVLVSRFGVFGEVCSAGFDDVAATIVCKSLGFETGASRNVFSSAEDVPMWIFDMSCSEASTDLKSCKHNTGPHPKGYCNNAAGVFCQNKEDSKSPQVPQGRWVSNWLKCSFITLKSCFEAQFWCPPRDNAGILIRAEFVASIRQNVPCRYHKPI